MHDQVQLLAGAKLKPRAREWKRRAFDFSETKDISIEPARTFEVTRSQGHVVEKFNAQGHGSFYRAMPVTLVQEKQCRPRNVLMTAEVSLCVHRARRRPPRATRSPATKKRIDSESLARRRFRAATVLRARLDLGMTIVPRGRPVLGTATAPRVRRALGIATVLRVGRGLAKAIVRNVRRVSGKQVPMGANVLMALHEAIVPAPTTGRRVPAAKSGGDVRFVRAKRHRARGSRARLVRVHPVRVRSIMGGQAATIVPTGPTARNARIFRDAPIAATGLTGLIARRADGATTTGPCAAIKRRDRRRGPRSGKSVATARNVRRGALSARANRLDASKMANRRSCRQRACEAKTNRLVRRRSKRTSQYVRLQSG